MTAEHKTKLVHALLKVNYALKNIGMSHVIRQGYADIGMFPYNYKKIISRCMEKLTLEQDQVMENNLRALSGYLMEQGELTDKAMDDRGIVNLNNELYNRSSRDNLSLFRQRLVVLTNKKILQGRGLYIEKRTLNRQDSKTKKKRKEMTKSTKNDIEGDSKEHEERDAGIITGENKENKRQRKERLQEIDKQKSLMAEEPKKILNEMLKSKITNISTVAAEPSSIAEKFSSV